MIYSDRHSDYYSNKMVFLKQYLHISEELLSSIENWESYDIHLAAREAVLEDLQELEEAYSSEDAHSCTEDEKDRIDQMISLILALDKDIAASISDIRLKTLESIKTAAMEKRITDYGYGDQTDQSGRLFDYKK
ncbi:MAG TPA: hypothetical protein PLV37_05115 [Bacillota bacterium]|jgi:hypothetical protein|nr:hypothetical protein [Bacillota bacterium]